MSHTLPDYTGKYVNEHVYGEVDNGELAVRLKSPVSYDRRGNVVWMDDFEDNINKWTQTHVGAGGSIELSTEAARNGASSCKLITPSDTTLFASIQHGCGMLGLSNYGVELNYAHQVTGSRLILTMGRYDGAINHYGVIDITQATGVLRIYDQITAAYVTLDTLSVLSEPEVWHTLKLVIDMRTNMYVRAMFNETTYDLSDYGLLAQVIATSPHIAWNIKLSTLDAGNEHVYIDDVIVTQNEP